MFSCNIEGKSLEVNSRGDGVNLETPSVLSNSTVTLTTDKPSCTATVEEKVCGDKADDFSLSANSSYGEMHQLLTGRYSAGSKR